MIEMSARRLGRVRVLDVEPNAFVVGEVVSAGNLPQPRDTGPKRRDHREGISVARNLGGHDRPPPHDTHVAGQHIPELGKLVEAAPPQDPPDSRDARVSPQLEVLFEFLRQRGGFTQYEQQRLVGIGDHRPELQAAERTAVSADAFAGVERRSSRRKRDCEIDDGEYRKSEHQDQRRDDDVDNALATHRTRQWTRRRWNDAYVVAGCETHPAGNAVIALQLRTQFFARNYHGTSAFHSAQENADSAPRHARR